MREYKFRAWDEEYKQIIYIGPDSCFANYPDEYIMQYTGLKDKNGKEIYEGDIVMCTATIDNKDVEGTRTVRFSEDLGFCLALEGHSFGLPLTWGGFESIEVIGNIYENTELLTK